MASPHAVSVRARRLMAWALPVVVVAGVLGGVVVSGGSASGSIPNLPHRTPSQLLASVQRTSATALWGTVRESAALGIPDLPGQSSSASLSWQTFIAGTHEARVWINGADMQRVALIGQLSEAEVVHNGPDVWTYTSDTNTVTHTVMRQRSGKDGQPGAETAPSATDLTPPAIAARILKAVRPSTSVTVDTSRMVAGRAAYTLVLAPRDTRSTVQRVNIAIDARTFVPLRVQVVGDGGRVAFEVGFTKVSFTRSSAATFNFRPPAGATTSTDPLGTHQALGARRHHDGARPATSSAAPTATSRMPKVIGSGWTTVLEVPAGSANMLSGGLLAQLTSPVGSSGDRLLHTALVNAVIRSDGTAFVGAVSPAFVENVAATTTH